MDTRSSNVTINSANYFDEDKPFSPSDCSQSDPHHLVGCFPATILGGRYERIKELGRGANGVVHLCRRTADGKHFAVKEIRYQSTKECPPTPTIMQHQQQKRFSETTMASTTTNLATTLETRRSLISEGSLLSKIPKHDYIVHLEEVGEETISYDSVTNHLQECDDGGPLTVLQRTSVVYQQSIFMVMEYAVGNLRDLVYPLSLLQDREDRKAKTYEDTLQSTQVSPRFYSEVPAAITTTAEFLTHTEMPSISISITKPVYIPPHRSNLIRLSTLNTELSDEGLFDDDGPKDSRLSERKAIINTSNYQRPTEPEEQPPVAIIPFHPKSDLTLLCSTNSGQSTTVHSPTDTDQPSTFSIFSPTALRERTASAFTNDKSFPEETLVRWFTQLATAVEFLHSKGIAHRDIKLANVLLVEEDNMTVCKLCDFGVAATVTAGAISTLGAKSLTEHSFLTNYMRPGSANMARARKEERLRREFDYSPSPGYPAMSLTEISLSCSPLFFAAQSTSTPRAIVDRRLSRPHRTFSQTPLEETISSPVGIRARNVAHTTFDDDTVGTPQYMAPEICDGRPHSLQCDVWSLGVSFYEICARRLPFDASNMLALMHKVIENPAKPLPAVYSPRLSSMILSMLAKDPLRRPTMKQVVQMLLHYQKLRKSLDTCYDKLQNDPSNESYKAELEKAIAAFLDSKDLGVKNFIASEQPTNPRPLMQMLYGSEEGISSPLLPTDTVASPLGH